MPLTEDEFASQLKADFLVEAAEHLTHVEAQILALEKGSEPGPIINSLFRPLHTMKGSAAMVGLLQLSSLAHAYETFLGRLRGQAKAGSAKDVEILLAGLDAMKKMIRELRSKDDAAVDAKVMQLLQSGLANDPVPHKVTPAHEPSAIKPTEPSPRRPRRILIVDDDAAMLEVLTAELRVLNCQCLTATDGEQALQLWRREEEQFDLLIADQRMPVMSGSEFLSVVRHTNSQVPAIIISGMSQKKDTIAFLNLKVHAFLEKPLNFAALLTEAKAAILGYERQICLNELTSLTMHSYLAMRRVAAQLSEEKNQALAPSLDHFSGYLYRIGDLINRLKNPHV